MKPYYTKLEDGSAILEFISPDVRFGINIELNSDESGWFYVTKDFSKNESGLLPPEFQRLLTSRALDFAYCTCKVFIPSVESTLPICRSCGKPQSQ